MCSLELENQDFSIEDDDGNPDSDIAIESLTKRAQKALCIEATVRRSSLLLRTLRIPRRATAMLVYTVFLGCAQTGFYAPKPVTAAYRLQNFSKSNLQIVVRDLRAERSNSVELISAIQSQISNALAQKASGHNRYT